jgi:hypothetical protein
MQKREAADIADDDRHDGGHDVDRDGVNGDATGNDQGARTIAVADKVLPAGVAELRMLQ